MTEHATVRRHPVVLVLLALFVTFAGLVLPTPAQAVVGGNSYEYSFLKKINEERVSRGLAAVSLSSATSSLVTRPWSSAMASSNTLAHNPNYVSQISSQVTSSWWRMSENVGYGPNVPTLHAMLMNSPGHRANILDPNVTWVGIGVVVSGGRMWVTENFIGTSSALAADVPPMVPATTPSHDYTGDGRPDLVAREGASGALWIYPSAGNDTWLPRMYVGSGWGSITAIVAGSDFDGDGKADLLARWPDGGLYLYAGNGAGGFDPGVPLGFGWGSMTALVAAGDMNGDGRSDLLARDPGGWLWAYLGTGNGFFSQRVLAGKGWNGMSSLSGPGDFNSDGAMDLLAVDGSGVLWTYLGNKAGGFCDRTAVGPGWNTLARAYSVQDFSGDGKSDVFGQDPVGTQFVYTGTGTGSADAKIPVGGGWWIMDSVG